MRLFAVAGIQAKVSSQPDQFAKIVKQLDTAVRQFPWVEMFVLSELAARGPSLDLAEPLPGPTEQALCELAEKHEIWLVPGSLYERADDGHIYNTTSVIDPTGTVVGRHRKLFPFTPYESGVTPGDAPLVFDVPSIGRFGVSICYDMWFPETSRWLVTQGVEVILHPALTDTIDRDIEMAMVRATAAQNQCYVLDVNGLDDGGVGRSLFVGPSGDVLHQAGSHTEEIPLEIDLDRVSRSREVGLRGLGQPLKSFRDRAFDFPCYQPNASSPYLDSLGPVQKQTRRSKLGLTLPDDES